MTNQWRSAFAGMLVALVICAPRPAAAQSDVLPPQLVGLSINPSSVDVTNADQTVTFTVHVTDDLSGVTVVSVTLTGPNGQQAVGFRSGFGLGLDVALDVDVRVPRYSQPGSWTVRETDRAAGIRRARRCERRWSGQRYRFIDGHTAVAGWDQVPVVEIVTRRNRPFDCDSPIAGEHTMSIDETESHD